MAVKNNALTFRHPLLMDKNGKPGRLICRGIAAFEKEQGKINDSMKWLLDNKPRLRTNIPNEKLPDLHPEALKAWFTPLTVYDDTDKKRAAAIKKHKRELRMSRIEEQLAKQAGMTVPDDLDAFTMKQSQYVTLLLNRIIELEGSLNRALIDLNAKTSELKGVIKATGRADSATESLTILQCFDHFKKVWKSPSQLAYDVCIQRVGYVVDAIGPNIKQVAVTRAMIESAIDGSKHSVSMKKRLYSVAKSFFTTLAYAPESNGLGLRNPAESIEIPTKPKMKPQITDPRTLLALPLSDYWRAFSAVVGFGGLRLAEAGALIWDHVDFDNEIIKVLPTEAYPELKSLLSDRPIKPFPNVWPILKRWKKAKVHETLVFPRIGGEERTGETWFRVYKDLPNAADLSAAFKWAINDALSDRLLDGLEADDDKIIWEILDSEVDLQPALKLRHWWETTMRANGYGGLIEDTGGHSDEVGRTHYTNVEAIVKAAKIKEL